MATIESLLGKYESLDRKIAAKGEEAIDTNCLLAFEYQYPHQPSEINMDTDEFSALCPLDGPARLRHPDGLLTCRASFAWS